MATEVKMPRLSLTMEAGTVIQWMRKPGDFVAKGDDLAEIETDKVNVVMEAPAAGFLRDVVVAAGLEVPCDTTIALLTATADEPLDGYTPASEIAVPTASVGGAAALPESIVDAAPAGHRAYVNASPAAKNLAKQLGVDLMLVSGTGPDGRIGLEDVRRTADAVVSRVSAGDAGDHVAPLSNMRAAIAHQMAASVATVPQFTVRRRLDLTNALRMHGSRAADGDRRAPGVIDLIHLAAIRALLEHREVNASYQAGAGGRKGAIVLHGSVHLGIAVALPDGLIVPVIRDSQRLSLDDLATARLQLQEQARAGRLAVGSLGGATFTVSNLGTLNVDDFTAIVNPPEAAILAVGRMQDTLVVRDGAIHTVPLVSVTVSADHRILDGATVARFLETMAAHLDLPGREG